MFSGEFYEISKSSFSYRTPLLFTSVYLKLSKTYRTGYFFEEVKRRPIKIIAKYATIDNVYRIIE